LLVIDGSIMTLVVLVAAVVATVSGLEKSACIIFEADGLFPISPSMNRDAVQRVKNTKVMPRLLAPMIETFIGEALLFIMMISGVAVGDGQALLALILVFFFATILYLTYHFYQAGKPGSHHDEEIR
jgi:hypothetical protein